VASTPCPACGHSNRRRADACASCGSQLATGDITTEHRTVEPDASPGTVHVDRSAFGRHQGLFVVNQGPKAGARYALDTDVVSVGRDPKSDIFLDDVTVSRRHAEVARDGARYSIRDVGSLNGTYVNRQLVDEGELNEGDEVQVGKFKLVFVHGTSPE
jgi:hypothetical protein